MNVYGVGVGTIHLRLKGGVKNWSNLPTNISKYFSLDINISALFLVDNAPPLLFSCPYHTLVAFLARKLAIFSWVINDLGPITLS